MDFSDSAIKPMFHWATSWDGYWREPHHDTQGRLWSFIIFFNDKQWDGGDLITHNDSNVVFHARRYFLKKLPIMNVVEAKENRGVFWLSSPNSYHSVSLQKNTIENRRFIYGSLCFQGKSFNRRIVKKINPINFVTDLISHYHTKIIEKFYEK